MTHQDTTPENAAQQPAESGTTEPPAVPTASTRPSRWGRVDADGTVHVTTSAGERAVGSWQAGNADEGLALFARKFDDLVTEVELLETRLSTHAGDPKHTLSSAEHLRDGLAEAAVVGDLDALAARLDHLVERSKRAIESAKAEKERARADAVAKKEALVAEAEQIGAESTQWKAAGDRLRAMVDEWKRIRGADRKTDEQLWRRFAKARDTFNRRRGSHFAELDRVRGSAKQAKEELCVRAEALSDSTDWSATSAAFRDLLSQWKAAGRAAKDVDDALWRRFKAAQDTFFSARNAANAEREDRRAHV